MKKELKRVAMEEGAAAVGVASADRLWSLPSMMRTTCGFCQVVCSSTRKERKRNYEAILASGEVVEGPGFSFRVVKSGNP